MSDNFFGLPPIETASAQEETSHDANTENSSAESSVTTQSTPTQDTSYEVPRFEFKTPEAHLKSTEAAQPQETINGYTPEQFEQLNSQFNSFFEFDPMGALLQGMSAGFKVNLSDEQRAHLNQKYLELFDSDPIAAQAWNNKISVLEQQQILKQQQEQQQSQMEIQQKVLDQSRTAVEEITSKIEYFKDPVFEDFLFRLANDNAEADKVGRFTDAGDYFREAAQQIQQAIEVVEKRGYERAKAEFQKKTSAYVEGSGNLVPPRTQKDDMAEAVQNKDLDAILSHKLRNLKRPV